MDIKFKSWYKKDNLMIDWSTLTQSAWNTFRGDTPLSLIYEVLVARKHDFETLLFTSFVDENGKEIYVGDFFNGVGGDSGITYFEVKYERGEIVVYNNIGKWGTLKKFIEFASEYDIKVEVIGNIYENSKEFKLIKGE